MNTQCESCYENEAVDTLKGIKLCQSCYETELRALKVITPEVQAEESPLDKIKKYDQTLQVRSDIFNAEIASLSEIKKVILVDNRIINKNFKYCEVVQERVDHLKKLIFEKQQELNELHSRARVNQQSLMEYANKLREEEREKLKLQDLSYKPSVVKIAKAKTVSIKKKVDRVAVKGFVNQLNEEFPNLNFTEALFQMMMVQKGRGPEDTYFDLRKKLKEAKSA